MRRLTWTIMGIALGVIPVAAPAQDAKDAVLTVTVFRRALESGNETAALRLLAPELLIYESGDQDRSRSNYAKHHLGADMAFLAKAKVRVLEQTSSGDRGLAWVATRSRIVSGARELIGTETMVLRSGTDGWRIVHIHWSSRPATRNDD